MFFRMLLVPLVVGLSQIAAAAEYATPTEKLAVGESTRALLGVQRNGKQAGPELPMLGAASALSYQRYLESHKYKIPERFSSSLGQGGSGGSGSGGGSR